MELDDGEDDAELDALDVSEALLLLAIEPLVLPVSLNELEDDELGEELAEFEEEASLVATEPLVEDVLFDGPQSGRDR